MAQHLVDQTVTTVVRHLVEIDRAELRHILARALAGLGQPVVLPPDLRGVEITLGKETMGGEECLRVEWTTTETNHNGVLI